ncbi:MAG: cysteine desulfurase [Nitrososphaerales archaeon]|nr:cysteine desulfurase [Nitrososphaerales archaeon]
MLDVETIRKDFPILRRRINGKPLIYFDNAATSQKPKQVIKAILKYYSLYNANIHRTVHTLGVEATEAYENVRDKIAKFINAKYREEVLFVRNTTEAINLVAFSWGRANISKGDTIVLTEMEHHSNIVPWQLLAREKSAHLKYIGITDDGLLKKEEMKAYLETHPKILAITHASNVLGTINPIKEIVKYAHKNGVTVLVDGAQSVPHMPVDVQDLDCDFLAFSAHKMLGPTGVGVLYGKRELLEKMEPYQGGGDMIKEVHRDYAKWNDLPWKFEAGTSNIADVIGFGVAIDYLNKIGMDNVRAHEIDITSYALKRMSDVDGLRIYGPMDVNQRCGVVSFNIDNIHPHDVATLLDGEGIAIRSGHLCAQPLMERLNVPAVNRASFYIYNTKEEVDTMVEVLKKIKEVFKI